MKKSTSEAVQKTLDDLGRLLQSQQAEDGSWRYFLEGSVLPDCYALIFEVLFAPTDTALVERLAAVISKRQGPNGAWNLYPDHPGDLSTTLEAYLALRLAGFAPSHPTLCRARDFVASCRDEQHLSNLTRISFAAFGIVPWSAVPALPPELMLLPASAPASLYELVSFTRVHLPAIMILAALGKQLDVPVAAELRALLAPHHLRILPRQQLWARPAQWLYEQSQLVGRASDSLHLRGRAIAACRRFILERIEADGTVGSYILSTAFSMLALRALDLPEDLAALQRMKAGLRSLLVEHEGEVRMQPCTATVWDTALNLAVVRRLGVSDGDAKVQRAAEYLLEREITEFAELRQRSPRMHGGAWGFQDINRFYPDVDDTCAVLDALRDLQGESCARAQQAFARGVEWVFLMQNRDGGWSAFDVDCSRRLLEELPFNDMRRAMTDPSSGDMTGRTLSFVARLDDPRAPAAIRRALRWLDQHQEADGSYWGRWGISYLYGTWGALLGYGAAGVMEGESAAVDRACAWLRSVQNPDGGFGESCRSDELSRFVPRSVSTPSQTAWALEGLLAVSRSPGSDAAVQRATAYLLDSYVPGRGWPEHYPTGAGFAGKLYLYYHNYKNLWPAMALMRLAERASLAERKITSAHGGPGREALRI